MRNYGRLLCALCFLLVVASCSESGLPEMVEYLNQECPQSIGDFGEITSYQYIDGNLKITFSVNEEYMDFDLISENEEIWKSNLLTLFQNDSGSMSSLFDKLAEANAGFTCLYVGKQSGREYNLTISRRDIAKISKSKVKDPISALQSKINILEAQLPVVIEEGIVMSSIEIAGEYVVYVCECDEDLYDISEMQNYQNDIKQSLLCSFADESDGATQQEISLIKNANMGCKYMFVGNQTGKSILITIEYSEL